ncbi:MAG: hypothetical protein L0G99_06075, partial [Propionibacteriales bacterium]|nr:hypothetical protein [Propionibacteriales bacterium]
MKIVDALARAGRWMMPGATGHDPGSSARSGGIAGLVVGVLSAAVMVIRLLVPTQVGTTDAGGRSLLCRMGLANAQPFGVEASAGYLHPRWVPHQWFGEACGTDAHVSTMT